MTFNLKPAITNQAFWLFIFMIYTARLILKSNELLSVISHSRSVLLFYFWTSLGSTVPLAVPRHASRTGLQPGQEHCGQYKKQVRKIRQIFGRNILWKFLPIEGVERVNLNIVIVHLCCMNRKDSHILVDKAAVRSDLRALWH